ncbi:hypothetical protein EPA93_04530 [Ktedonosporobacter rubrisoli]|uniref:Uncharacterized protein n=1 Tax=Ktedonosporobacter rubrisoli TaxID=2509675 RepID=A0A4P6JJT8_KTERU|nr:hypothetical protein [Ktedonosporobacter rubrisoli]QBD75303.1 hypothetical protein EPA93_04530 [Ktedonosporobacter rubrisoli]
MNSIADGSVIIQSTSESVSSTPYWFGEMALRAAYLRKHGILTKISERVHFTCKFARFVGQRSSGSLRQRDRTSHAMSEIPPRSVQIYTWGGRDGEFEESVY